MTQAPPTEGFSEHIDRYLDEPTRAIGAILRKDLIAAANVLGNDEIRFLVDSYYTIQEQRKRAANQSLALDGSGEPHEFLTWLTNHSERLEETIRRTLTYWTIQQSTPVTEWLMSIVGIGPVITSGLMTTIDITEAPTVGHIWAFAGLDPTRKWEKRQKRPWNAFLKTLCAFKIGESFVKVSNHKDDVYGHIYAERKLREISRNEEHRFSDQAASILATKDIGKETDAYKAYIQGMLPPAHIHRRATRVAVKLFLAHLHEVMFWVEYGKLPPDPYPIAHLGHAHYIPIPNLDRVPGLEEARRNYRPQ